MHTVCKRLKTFLRHLAQIWHKLKKYLRWTQFVHKMQKPETVAVPGFASGEAGIRTRARVAPTNGLANRPLQPTWVLLHS